MKMTQSDKLQFIGGSRLPDKSKLKIKREKSAALFP